jgi:hypothetical protein
MVIDERGDVDSTVFLINTSTFDATDVVASSSSKDLQKELQSKVEDWSYLVISLEASRWTYCRYYEM